MTKKITLFLGLMLILFITGCSSAKKIIGEDKVKYNNIKATIVTTQGEISFYLYPEAAPANVSNFINLAKRGFYNNLKVHRAIDGFMAQTGDPLGTGEGGPGYRVADEVRTWLDFFQPGMLAMANMGPATNGSQFFMTSAPAEWLNGRYTVIGESIADGDLEKIKKLEVGDVIKEIRFTGNIDLILSINKTYVDGWNIILDEKFPGLAKYPIKDPSEIPDQIAAYQAELEAIYTRNSKSKEELKLGVVPSFIKGVSNKMKSEPEVKESETSYFN